MRPSVGSAAVAQGATPKSAERGDHTRKRYPTLATLADYESSLAEPLRARVRAILTEPLSQLRVHVERAESTVSGVDPEYGAFLLVEFLAELGPLLDRVEAQLSRALRL
jgi:hypothetical protein